MFSDHTGIRLEFSNRMITGKLSNIILNNPWVKEKTQGKLENILNWMKMKVQHTKICGMLLKYGSKEIL